MALQHTALEYQLEALAWSYFGDVDKGHIATAKMRMPDKIDVLKTLVEWTEPDDGIAERIEWAIESFEILRLNRNAVIHAFNFKADQSSGNLYLERRTKSLVFDSFEQINVTQPEMQQLLDDQIWLAGFLRSLQLIIDIRGPDAIGINKHPPVQTFEPLPPKPARPKKMTPLPRQAPISARRQRQSSQATEAKAAKSKRKDEQREAQNKKSQ